MAVFTAPTYKGGRPPTGQRLMDYLAHHEKREASYIVDVAGNELTADEAVQRIGDGIEGKDHWHAIIANHRAECDFLCTKLGLPPAQAAIEQARILAMDIGRRTGREAPLMAIHLEREEDGGMRWHYHPVGKGPEPKNLYGEKGHLQKIWDREMRDLMEGEQKIVDWKAHREWLSLRDEHQAIVKEQRELLEAHSRARKGHREATHGIQNMAAVNRWTFGAIPGLGVIGGARSIAQKQARLAVEKAHFATRPDVVNRRHKVETEMLRKRYQARGNEGSTWQNLEQIAIDSRRDKGLLQAEKFTALEGAELLKERSRKLRLASRVSLRVVPGLSVAAGISAFVAERRARQIERQFKGKELDLIRRSKESELRMLDAHYQALGMSGSAEHKMRAKEVERRASAAAYKVKVRGMDRGAVRKLQQANGKAISVAKRGLTRSTGVALETAKNLAKKAQERARVAEPHHTDTAIQKHHEVVLGAASVPKQVAAQVVRSTIEVGAEAARSAAAAAAKLAVRTATASAKLGVGLVMALPTGGASLGAASKSAAQDLGEGASEAGQELGKGSLRTAKGAAHGTKDVLHSGVRSLVSLGTDAISPAAREALQGLHKSATTSLQVGKDLLTLDIVGAGSNLASGGLEVAKHGVGAAGKGAKSLPAVARMPLRVAEALPIVGTLGKIARLGMEVGATATAAASKGGSAFEMEM
jgi:hypothetical protein